MLRLTNLKLDLNHQPEELEQAILDKLSINADQLVSFNVFKRGYDARRKNTIILMYTIDVDTTINEQLLEKFVDDNNVKASPDTHYYFVGEAPKTLEQRPVVIGFGPCGLFIGLVLAQMGFKPIILERGKEVRERTKDTFGFWRKKVLNTESNVQFGEGGAGTFSDGKLYSQVKDPKHYSRKVLHEFVEAGAPEEILYVSKPHIGTFKLVTMIEKMRAKIIELGGEIRFSQRVDDILFEENEDKRKVVGVKLATGEVIHTEHVALAVGHSARDTFKMLNDKNVYMVAKPFSIGFRIEHEQSVIDDARFGKNAGHPILGSADYKLVHHCKNGRSVYSFCMCPGGTVVAAASEEGRLVTNGMSQYSRHERNANSAIVVGIDPKDFSYGSDSDETENVLAGVELQRRLEEFAYKLGGESYDAPVQLVGDFLAGRKSGEHGSVEPSYKPGVTYCDLSETLPPYAIEAIREALPAFEKKIKGFAMEHATLTAVETRTSSPIQITRDKETYQSLNVDGLYPAGEGAGYAGGILSAGIDGIKVAEAIALDILKRQ
ncbi:NAD(P)/FAD-dependent oxidoreductase [Pseudocolwellia agarivorans]|uniref:NAD(P)/FAD-dependent oxidoreductase n=1 Tax=Pseudocolwellia agarivorans TaxID=1911682 RepID=UPI000986A9ED|nr:NAD(P)/FAD-dependent oxidoreductase [Pseudocolwellia agarivorans]